MMWRAIVEGIKGREYGGKVAKAQWVLVSLAMRGAGKKV